MKQNSTSSDIRAGSSQPELFTADGHLTDLAFKLLIDEQLDSCKVWKFPSIFLSATDAWNAIQRFFVPMLRSIWIPAKSCQKWCIWWNRPLPCTTRSCKQFRTKQGSSTLKKRLLWLLQPPLPLFSGAAAFCRTKISQRGWTICWMGCILLPRASWSKPAKSRTVLMIFSIRYKTVFISQDIHHLPNSICWKSFFMDEQLNEKSFFMDEFTIRMITW